MYIMMNERLIAMINSYVSISIVKHLIFGLMNQEHNQNTIFHFPQFLYNFCILLSGQRALATLLKYI